MSDTPATAPAPAPSALTPVRSFTEDGLAQVAELLKTIRADGQLHRKEIEDLLVDPQYAKPLSADPQQGGLLAGGFAIDRDRVFATKLDLCQYFTSLFDDAFLEAHRKDAGLWTWLALAYYPQFVKTKNGIAKLTANARWIYDPDNFQDGRRHYIAGNVYLYQDIKNAGPEALDMFLVAGPVTQFNTITDIMTHVQAGIQAPAIMKVAAWLYYDSGASTRIKKGTTTDNRKGSARRLTAVVQQLGETWDFYDLDNAPLLWKKLPPEFSDFKDDASH